MSICLYPNTRDRVKLEKIAGVAPGTYDRLDAMEAEHAAEEAACRAKGTWSDNEDSYRQWKRVNDDQALGDLNNFLLYGWGKFRDPDGLAASWSGCLDGSTPGGFDRAQLLLLQNGMNADAVYCEGVHWNDE